MDSNALFRAIPELYVCLDVSLHIIDITDAGLTYTKLKREQVVGKHLFVAFPPSSEEEKSLLSENFKKVLSTRKQQQLPPHRYDLCLDGIFYERYWRATHTPILGTDNEVTSILCSAQDITAEFKLKKNKSREILDHINDSFLLLDSEFRIVDANLVVLGYFNKSLEEVVGKHLDNFSPDIPERQKFRKMYEQVLKTGEPVHFEANYNNMVIQNSAYRTLSGELAIFSRDITVARRAEDQLRIMTEKAEVSRLNLFRILQSAPVPIALIEGDDLTFTLANKEFMTVFNMPDVVGKSAREVTRKGNTSLDIMKKVLETGKEHFEKEYNVPVGNGQSIYINITAKPYLDTNEKVIGIILVGFDVTELVLSRMQFEESLKMRDEFLSIASHELKTPLTSLQLQTEVAKRMLVGQDLSPDITAGLNWSFEVTHKGIARLSSLVDDMLDISRISNGKLSLNLEFFNLNKLVYEVIERLIVQLKLKNIDFQISPEAQVEGRWDPFRIEQVILNMITNAIKYAGNSPIRIIIRKDEMNAYLVFKDKGPGIAKKDHGRIFQRFERVDGKSSISGLGLGLYICQEIIERHGGKIVLTSDVDEGAEFSISLPLKIEEGP